MTVFLLSLVIHCISAIPDVQIHSLPGEHWDKLRTLPSQNWTSQREIILPNDIVPIFNSTILNSQLILIGQNATTLHNTPIETSHSGSSPSTGLNVSEKSSTLPSLFFIANSTTSFIGLRLSPIPRGVAPNSNSAFSQLSTESEHVYCAVIFSSNVFLSGCTLYLFGSGSPFALQTSSQSSSDPSNVLTIVRATILAPSSTMCSVSSIISDHETPCANTVHLSNVNFSSVHLSDTHGVAVHLPSDLHLSRFSSYITSTLDSSIFVNCSSSQTSKLPRTQISQRLLNTDISRCNNHLHGTTIRMAPDCGPVSVFNTTFRDCRSKGHPNCDEHDITYTGPTDPPLYYNGTVFDADEHHDFSRFDNDVHVYFELCTFRNMRYDCEDSSDGGGAIFSSPINCTMTIKKCMFHNCSCYGVEDDWDIEGFGGAIYVSGGYSSSGTFSLLDSTIDQCIVDYASGAVQVQSLPKVVLCGNIISRCNSPVGNGPASFVDVDDTIVHNCTFLNNEGALTGALAMFNDACGQTLVSNVHFRNSTCMRDSPLSKLRSDCFIYLCMAENTYVDCTTTSKRPNVYARDEEYDEDWYEPEDDNSTFEYSKLFLPILDSLSCSIEPTSQSLIQFAFAGKFVSDEQRYTMIVNDTNTHSQRELELVMRDGKLTTPDTHALRYNTLYTIIDFAKSSLSAELPLSLYAWDPASTIDTLVPFSFHTPQGPTLETIGGPVFDERGYVLSIPLHTIHVPLGEYVVHVLTPSGDTVELPAKFESKEESKIQIKIFSPDEDVDLSLALDANYTIVKIVKGTTQVQIDAPNLLLPPEPARIVSMAEASSTKNTISLNFTSKQIAFGVEYRMVLQEENGTEASNRIIPVTFSEASAIVEVDIINSSASATTRNSLSNSASLYDGRTYTLVSVFDSEGKKVYLEDCDVVKIDMVARAKAKQLTTTITVLSIVLGILGVLFLFLLIFLIIICWRKKKEEKKDEGEEETEESVGFTEETAGQTEEAELPAGKVSAEMEMTLTETEWTKSLETRPQPMDVMKEEPNEQADLSDETDRPHASEPLNSLPDSTIKEDVPVEETLAEKQLEEEPANVDENVERPKRKKKKKQAEQLEAEEETPETAPLLDAEEVAEEPAKKKKKKKKKKLMEELADEEEQSP